MKKGAKRQIVLCPTCGRASITLGEVSFRCCGGLHEIKAHLLNEEFGFNPEKGNPSPRQGAGSLEIMI